MIKSGDGWGKDTSDTAVSPCHYLCRFPCRLAESALAAVGVTALKLTTAGPGHKVRGVMPDKAATFETHLGSLDPALASALRMIMAEVRELQQSVHHLTQGTLVMHTNVDRTIAAARKLENAADAVVKVLNDTVANQREISGKFSEAQTRLAETQTQLEQALGKINTGSTAGAGELQTTVDELTRQLAEARGQIDQMSTAQTALDQLSDEMEAKADALGQAVVAGTSADPARAGLVEGAAPGTRLDPGGRIPGAGPSNLPPNTASNEGVQENLGNPDGNPGGAPGGQTATGPMTGVPTSQTDASSQAEPQSAPPVPPQNI